MGAGAALSAGRHTHRREHGLNSCTGLPPRGCSQASPTPTSVTQSQPGGPSSSVELVDVIGSSFHSGQRRVLVCRSCASSISLPPGRV